MVAAGVFVVVQVEAVREEEAMARSLPRRE